eukprot:1768158-Prymnesium_polylepis.1
MLCSLVLSTCTRRRREAQTDGRGPVGAESAGRARDVLAAPHLQPDTVVQSPRQRFRCTTAIAGDSPSWPMAYGAP